MKIGIINCDFDESEQTNCSVLLNKLIPDSVIVDYCKGERIDVDKFDGFVISGSRAHLHDDFPWIDNVINAVKEIKLLKKPCLAVCFGMHIITDVFGGDVQASEIQEEGFKEIQLDASSELFNDLPSDLKVYELHHDIVNKLPEKSKVIAKNEVCIQAFVFENFYCVQFHPEVTPKTAIIIAERDGDDIDVILNGVDMEYDVPVKIISNFVEIVNLL